MVGRDYVSNDHVALAVDLHVITQAGYEIVPLGELVDRFNREQLGIPRTTAERSYLALTFDDGPEYDVVDYLHPYLGFQRSFLGILQDFAASQAGPRQRNLCATSFVIASPEARMAIESATSSPYFLHPGAMNQDWWSGAVDSGLISVGNHSWDHLHPALTSVAHSRQAKGDFSQVDNEGDADAQILEAGRYIDKRVKGRLSPFFAYPFGQYSRFLVEEYFPGNQSRTGVAAAFTVDARPLRRSESVWSLPRYSCGYNWTTPEQLGELLAATPA